ncbi:centromere protein L-like [Homarus americanus]|uniref:centromere protein L-like n=1 Tax=Homarus americanus TaxID=6706 RepID=UPI001C4377D2|nr:centromere protein L-like [Homarus americanus]XP_042214576.1 centromere protein L-like [Homarus americanus]XP_042214587.1 centromere protein L-like [Homarus americanus]
MASSQKQGDEEKRPPRIMGKKPSPKKMSPAYLSKKTTSASKTHSNPRRRKQSPTSVESGKYKSTAASPKRKSPTQLDSTSPRRSGGRYELRNITPPSYSEREIPKVFNTPGRNLSQIPFTTPYRTPRLRSLGRDLAPDIKAAKKVYKRESQEWKEHLGLLLHKTLKLCNLSSVYNFNYKRKTLRTKYENALKHKVQQVLPSPLLTVKLTTTAFFTLKPGAVDAVHISIATLVPGLTVDEDKTVTVYRSWMFRTSEVQSGDIHGAEWFPIMLYTGRELIHYAVVEWLQDSFGCYITKYGMRQSDIMWMAGVWSGRPCPLSVHQKEDHQVQFIYHVRLPSGQKFSSPNERGKPKFVLKISLKEVHHIWECIVDSSRDEMNIAELQEFFSCMDNLASDLMYLPTSHIHLHQLYTPCLTLNSDGKVRLTCVRSASIVLNHLTDIFLQTTNSSALKDLFHRDQTEYLDESEDQEVLDEEERQNLS